MHDNDKFRWLPLDEVIGATAFALLLIVVPMVLSLERPALPTDQDAAWHRRHERNSADCRGQQYIAQCCEDARTDLTCVDIHVGRK